MTEEAEKSPKIVKRWRLGAGGFGVLTASVLICFGIPLPIFLGILVAIIAVTVWRKDLRLLFWGVFCSVGLPVFLIVAGSTASYMSAPAHLPGGCGSIDRPEEVCFDETYRAFRTNRMGGISRRVDLWSERTMDTIQSLTKRTLINLFGPSDESYQGPYIPRHEAQDFLVQHGQKVDLATIEERPDDDTARQLLRKHCEFVFRFSGLRWQQRDFARSQVGDSEFDRRCFDRALEAPERHRVYIHEVQQRLLLLGTSDPIRSLSEINPYPIDTVVLVDLEDERVVDYFLYHYDYY